MRIRKWRMNLLLRAIPNRNRAMDTAKIIIKASASSLFNFLNSGVHVAYSYKSILTGSFLTYLFQFRGNMAVRIRTILNINTRLATMQEHPRSNSLRSLCDSPGNAALSKQLSTPHSYKIRLPNADAMSTMAISVVRSFSLSSLPNIAFTSTMSIPHSLPVSATASAM